MSLARLLVVFNSLLFIAAVSMAARNDRVQVQLTAQDMLSADLSKGIKTFERDTRLYHYFNITQWYTNLATPEGRQLLIQSYFNAVINKFWNLGFNEAQLINAGPGLYAAVDPHISKQFGNTVLELTVPNGEKYLDVVRTIQIKGETIKQLIKEEILNQSLVSELMSKNGSNYIFTRDTLKTVIAEKFTPFRKALHNFFLEKSVSIIEYNWNSSLSGLCKNPSVSAFVFIGSKTETAEGAASFKDNIKKHIVYGAELTTLTDEEKSVKDRTTKFRDLLEKLTTEKERSRRELISSIFADQQELKDIISKTFKCEAR